MWLTTFRRTSSPNASAAADRTHEDGPVSTGPSFVVSAYRIRLPKIDLPPDAVRLFQRLSAICRALDPPWAATFLAPWTPAAPPLRMTLFVPRYPAPTPRLASLAPARVTLKPPLTAAAEPTRPPPVITAAVARPAGRTTGAASAAPPATAATIPALPAFFAVQRAACPAPLMP